MLFNSTAFLGLLLVTLAVYYGVGRRDLQVGVLIVASAVFYAYSQPILLLLLVGSALAALLVPSLGLEDYHGRLVWRGVTASKNTLGFWAAVAILLFAVRAVETPSIVSRLSWLGLAALAVGCLVASVSATSSLALVIAALAMLYVHAATELRLGIVPMAVLALLVGGLVSLAVGSIDTAELIGRSGNLTGRIDVWSETWRLILDRPLGGYGYGTLWFPTEASVRIQERLMDLSWTVYHAHNGLLQIASEVGMPLAVLTVIVVVQQLIETLWCQYRRPQGATLFVIGFSVALLVSNYAEARLLVNRDLFWIFFVALPISVVRQAELGVPAWPSSSSARWRRGQRSPAERRAALERRRDLKRRLRLKDGSDLPEGIAADAVRPPTERG